MEYRVLFLGYWNLNDPLTHATVFPHLSALKELGNVKYLHFANTQRGPVDSDIRHQLEASGISYTPLFSKNFSINQLNKIYDFVLFPKLIKTLCEKYCINFVIARGAPAGSLAYLAWKKTRIPFIVESFEPHAEYMRQSGTWKWYDLRYVFQKYWERKQIELALALIVVSERYRSFLLGMKSPPAKVFTVPCAINTDTFRPNAHDRENCRNILEIPLDAVVGVYAGKFGNLYYDEEAFLLFQTSLEVFGSKFYLLILTNHKEEFLFKRLDRFNIPRERVRFLFVNHDRIPQYLNCADFAYAPIRQIPVSIYQSPVKVGEYLACGLPILLTANVGDESAFIEKQRLGALVLNYKNNYLRNLLINFKASLEAGFDAKNLREFVKEHRNPVRIKETYRSILT